MTAVYVCSDHPREGKTAFAIAFGRRLQRDGVSIGYWKPLSFAGPEDADAAFAKQVLRLPDDLDVIAPFTIDRDAGTAREVKWHRELLPSFLMTIANRDVLLVEGYENVTPIDPLVTFLAEHAVQARPTKAIYVAHYRDGNLVDRILGAKRQLGSAFAGAIINAVPEAHRWLVSREVEGPLAAARVPVFGVLPQDSAMAALTIRELAAALEARVLVNGDDENMDRLFESVMFGAMSAEDGAAYFRRRQRKLVVSRGDRPDVHLAALGTSTRCLLLTGGYHSYPFVLDRAEELNIPVLSVAADFPSTIDTLDTILAGSRARTVAKIDRFEKLLDAHLRWPDLRAAVGLTS